MKNKELVAIVIYLIVMLGTGIGFGCMLVREEYDKLKIDYDVLEIQYKKDLDDCHQQIGDMQDDYDVNNDGLINASDYVAIKNFIMAQDEECFVNGGWNCE